MVTNSIENKDHFLLTLAYMAVIAFTKLLPYLLRIVVKVSDLSLRRASISYNLSCLICFLRNMAAEVRSYYTKQS
jgi:hypothetical protein